MPMYTLLPGTAQRAAGYARRAAVLALLVVLLVLTGSRGAAQPPGPVYIAHVDGIVTSVTIDYLRRALQVAETSNATALVIRLNSNGGVLRDVQSFAAEVADAEVPVVVYVAPEGTQAGATGSLLLSAAHISAMAPDTSFGSAYPLADVDAALTQQTQDLVLDSLAEQLRTWNAARGRNTSWIDRAVREGAQLTNEQAAALEPPAIDLVASDQPQLLTLLEGRTVALMSGTTRTLVTLGRQPVPIEPTLWESLRLALADPTLAFVLLVLGAVAIYLELAAPGTTLFAGTGVVLLIAAIAGLVVLPVQWWALLLLIASFVVMGTEFFVPAHGAMTLVGLLMMVVGALNLIDPLQAPGVTIAVWAILVFALVLAGFAALGVWLILRNRNQPVATGQEGLIGRLAQVRQPLDPQGMVFVEGALWQAISEDGPVDAGEWMRITGMHDLHLIVRRLEAPQHDEG